MKLSEIYVHARKPTNQIYFSSLIALSKRKNTRQKSFLVEALQQVMCLQPQANVLKIQVSQCYCGRPSHVLSASDCAWDHRQEYGQETTRDHLAHSEHRYNSSGNHKMAVLPGAVGFSPNKQSSLLPPRRGCCPAVGAEGARNLSEPQCHGHGARPGDREGRGEQTSHIGHSCLENSDLMPSKTQQ